MEGSASPLAEKARPRSAERSARGLITKDQVSRPFRQTICELCFRAKLLTETWGPGGGPMGPMGHPDFRGLLCLVGAEGQKVEVVTGRGSGA